MTCRIICSECFLVLVREPAAAPFIECYWVNSLEMLYWSLCNPKGDLRVEEVMVFSNRGIAILPDGLQKAAGHLRAAQVLSRTMFNLLEEILQSGIISTC